jgi:hypothetical protein
VAEECPRHGGFVDIVGVVGLITLIPVVPHKAVAEVSKIGNL